MPAEAFTPQMTAVLNPLNLPADTSKAFMKLLGLTLDTAPAQVHPTSFFPTAGTKDPGSVRRRHPQLLSDE